MGDTELLGVGVVEFGGVLAGGGSVSEGVRDMLRFSGMPSLVVRVVMV